MNDRRAARDFRDPLREGRARLRYFWDVRLDCERPFVVVLREPGREDRAYRHATLDAARACWRDLQQALLAEGYEPLG